MASLAPPIVGRERELARLERALDALAAGLGAALAIEGEPGIGKTRLLAELAARAEERGFLVLSGVAAEFDQEVPFAVVVEAFDAYLASHLEELLPDAGSDLAADLAAIFPAARTLAEPAVLGPDDGYRAHRAMRTLLERIASLAPLAILLDDLHWADAASLDLIAAMLRRPPDPVVLLAVAYRPGQAPARLEPALAVPGMRRMPLAPLSEAEANELLGPTVDADRRAWIYHEARGNAFCLEQLARVAGSARARRGEHGDGGVDLPPAVAAAVAEELQALSTSARLVLDSAAVVGEPFEADVALQVAELPATDGLRALDELLGADLLRPTEVPRRFAFRHPLLRRLIYDASGGGWRLEAHARAAAVLAESGAPAAERAYHVEHAAPRGDEKAVAVLLEAGDSVASYAPAGAVRWYGAALRLLPQDASAQRLELLPRLASALTALGELEQAHAALEEALRLSENDGGGLRTELVARCAAVEHWLGRHTNASRRLIRARDELAERNPAEAATLEIELAHNALYEMDFERHFEMGNTALARARQLGDRALIARAAAALCAGESGAGRMAEAAEHCEEGLHALHDLEGDPGVRLDALSHAAWTESYLERFDDALGHIDAGLAVARDAGHGRLVVPLVLAKAYPLSMRGRLTEAAATCEEALESARLTGNPRFLSWALWELGRVCCLAGDIEAAIAHCEESAAARGGLVHSIRSWGQPGFTLGFALIEGGDPARGREVLLEAFGGLEASWVVPVRRCLAWELLTRAELALGHTADALSLVERAERWAERLPLGLPTAEAARARAELMLAQGNPAAAATAAEAATRAGSAAGAVLDAAFSRALAGRALAEAGERERAVEELRLAERELDSYGALRRRDAARRALRKLGARSEPRGPTGTGEGLGALTDREREVAQLVADRHTNREIAERLFLSEKTVESHLRNVFAKLGVSSRVEVARLVERERRAG
jgi:DNA-binding CsgD family transcriptional regulator